MSTADDSLLEDLASDFTARIRAGESPTIESYAREHPEHSEDIRDMLSSIQLLEQLSQSESESREQANSRNAQTAKIEKLGDFEIVREIGRGGMGVVYEAIDATLHRRVALKVLNDSALSSQKHVERFQRESRLAAQLHHTNIVSVFGVGEEDGKHFYAMQFVDGVSIHEILEGLKSLESTDSPSKNTNDNRPPNNLGDSLHQNGHAVATALRNGRFANAKSTCNLPEPPTESAVIGSSPANGRVNAVENDADEIDDAAQPAQPNSATNSATNSADETENTGAMNGPPTPGNPSPQERNGEPPFDGPYWQSVARIGVQVADALRYAHRNGVLHRDIKPANLIFDSSGTVWVADFGLAKPTDADDLTKTGDVVGTLKYMAPEQLAGKADARTDIYGLGQTLYELLTLKPVCDGETYQSLLTQKQAASHTPPRKLNPAVPRDLETVVQKALACEPEKRYATARELADDLQRFLEDEPVLARRVTIAEKAWRWCRRNRSLATLGTMVACLMILLPIVLGWAYVRQASQNERLEGTIDVVLDGFDELFGSYLDDHAVTTAALSESSADVQLAPAMLTKDTANVLEKMLVVYDRLAEVNASSDDLGLATESARARHRVGDLYQQLGQFAKANEAYQDAAARYTSLRNSGSQHQIELARIHQAMGKIHEQSQHFELAHAQYEEAIEALELAPRNGETTFELARIHYLLGKAHSTEGEPEPPEVRRRETTTLAPRAFRIAHLNEAIQLVRELRTQDTKNPAYRLLLALCIRDKEQAGFSETATEGSSVELLTDLVNQFPTIPRYRYELCETYRQQYRFSPNIDLKERLRVLHLANELGEQLVQEQRDSAPFRILLAHTYAHLGMTYGGSNDIKHAEAFTRLSIATHESITYEFPGLAPLSDRLSTNDKIRLGGWLLDLHRYEEVIELVQPLAQKLYEQLKELSAGPNGTHASLMECVDVLLPAYERTGDSVGYLVALDWLNQGSDQGRPPMFRRGRPPQNVSFAELAMGFDENQDGRITRNEVPSRMASEWFRRFDKDNSDDIDEHELGTPSDSR